jgi:hypothetical protein
MGLQSSSERGEKSMFQTKMLGVALLLAMTFLPFEVMAQPKYAKGMMFCTSDMDGKGLALVKLSNLTKLTIPKGKALFAKKSNETIEFTAAEPIAEGGSATYRTHAAGFQVEGPCEGWY